MLPQSLWWKKLARWETEHLPVRPWLFNKWTFWLSGDCRFGINDFEWSCSWVIFLLNGEQRWDLNFLIVSLGTAECLLAAMLSCFSFATPFFFLCHACLAAHTASSPVMEKRRFCSRSTSMEHQWATGFTIPLYSYSKGGEMCGGVWSIWGKSSHGAMEGMACNPLVLGDGNCWNWWLSSLQPPAHSF